eukprot:9728040-Alexandrium_andersonii.AAC.1
MDDRAPTRRPSSGARGALPLPSVRGRAPRHRPEALIVGPVPCPPRPRGPATPRAPWHCSLSRQVPEVLRAIRHCGQARPAA